MQCCTDAAWCSLVLPHKLRCQHNRALLEAHTVAYNWQIRQAPSSNTPSPTIGRTVANTADCLPRKDTITPPPPASLT
jgi:hypothetical protein